MTWRRPLYQTHIAARTRALHAHVGKSGLPSLSLARHPTVLARAAQRSRAGLHEAQRGLCNRMEFGRERDSAWRGGWPPFRPAKYPQVLPRLHIAPPRMLAHKKRKPRAAASVLLRESG